MAEKDLLVNVRTVEQVFVDYWFDSEDVEVFNVGAIACLLNASQVLGFLLLQITIYPFLFLLLNDFRENLSQTDPHLSLIISAVLSAESLLMLLK